MISFNLERALAGDPIQFANGVKVKDWHYFKEAQITDKIVTLDEFGLLNFHFEDGKHAFLNNELQLVMAPKKIKFWTNVFLHMGGHYFTGGMYETLEEAEINKSHYNCKYIKTQEIEVEV